MWCNMLTRSLLALGLCASAASAASYDQHYQVFLYPSPSNSHADAANTLTADQARSVFDHHLGNSYGGSDRKSRVVFVKGDVDVQDIIPSSMSTEPTFYLPGGRESAMLLLPYWNRARQVLDEALATVKAKTDEIEMPSYIEDAWATAHGKYAQYMHAKIHALSQFVEDSIDSATTRVEQWDSFLFPNLRKEKNGGDEAAGQMGCNAVRASIEAMAADSAQRPFAIIYDRYPEAHQRRRRDVVLAAESTKDQSPETSPARNGSTKAPKLEEAQCYASNRTCTYDTNSCNGNGVCTLIGKVDKKITKTGKCWACACERGFGGPDCKKQDYVFQTALLVLTPLLLIVIAYGSVYMLSAVGSETLPNTLTLSAGGGRKS